MYDELIVRLRGVEEMLKVAQFKEATNLIEQAADAIEERCQQVDKFAEEAARLYAKQPRWIPVTERLPDARQFVLAWKDEKPKGFACVSFWMDNAGWAFKNITHWMPLPEPPKEET